jgi:hypothetical protein
MHFSPCAIARYEAISMLYRSVITVSSTCLRRDCRAIARNDVVCDDFG